MASGGNGGFDEVLFVTFNQDATSLAVGTKRGYKLYPLNQLDDLKPLHEFALEDVCLVERLYSSSLVTLVTLTAPRKLQVCHFQKGQEICSQSYSNTILAVRLNRLRLVVCLEESLYIHNIRDMKMLHTIRDTPPNPQGLCELTSNDISYLAYPGSSTIGEVQIFDSSNLQAVTMIAAHNSPLAALKFNVDGTKLATASDKGTVIRVFAVPSGEKLFEFRRGMKRCVTIYSLAFSADSLFLCSSSNTETVHIFKLEHHDKEAKSKVVAEEQASAGGVQGWMNFVSKTAASYLPTQVSEIFHQDRAFAHAKLPQPGAHNVCALTVVKQQPRLLLASLDGYLYVYALDKTDGGECVLLKQHRLISSGSNSGSGVVASTTATTASTPQNTTPSTVAPTGPGGASGSAATAAAVVSGRSNNSAGGGAVASGTGTGAALAPKSAQQQQSRETSPSFMMSKTYAAMVQSQAESSTEQRLKRLVDASQPGYTADDLKLDDSREFPPMTHSPD